MDKQARVEAIAASLDASQKEEVEEMITPPERAQLAKVKHMTNKYVYAYQTRLFKFSCLEV